MISTILNLDTQENQFYYDSGYSDTPSPGSSSTSSRMMGSPMSQASDKYNMMNLYTLDDPAGQIGFQKNTSFFAPNMKKGETKLVLIEEPVEKFRFRYKSEMHGTHGSLMGSNNGKSRKTFPTVELRGYHGRAVIRCSLYQTDVLEPSPHSHKLVVRDGDIDVCDPHDLYVSAEEGYRAVFQGMGIIHTAKKYIFEELVAKKIKEKKFELGRSLTLFEESNIKGKAEKESKNMNLNQVRLGFTAYAVNSDSSWTWLCGPIFSRSINNMKSALTGELKISRLSAAVSSVNGGDDLILLVEKVGKKNIKVKFFEVDENDEEVWVDWGIFSEADVHHQYAIALRTPPYKNKDIDKHVDVFIQLFRPSDKDHSEPVPFRYKPRDFVVSRKRARTNSSGLSSFEIPETVFTEMQNNIKDSPQQSLSFSSINKSDILDKILNENIPPEFEQQVQIDSDELMKYVDKGFFDDDLDKLEADGTASPSMTKSKPIPTFEERRKDKQSTSELSYVKYFKNICSIGRMYAKSDPDKARHQILHICNEAKSKDDDILHNAIIHGDVNTMVKLLKLIDKLELSDVLQHQNERRQTCLHLVCIHDRSEYIRPLINLGANPNIQDYQGNTALHVAVEENMIMCASKIIEKSNYTKKSVQLQIDLANDNGLTPLHLAVKKKNLPLIKKLLEVGQSSTKICISKNGNNVLHLAVEQNDRNIVRYLLSNTKVNINEQNTSGFTPLRLAYSMNAKAVVQLLLEHGATNGSSCDDYSQMQMVVTSKSRTTDESSEEDEFDEKPLQIDEFRTQFNDYSTKAIFDDECIQQLKLIFDKDGKWRQLAKLLNLDSLTDAWKFSSSPTVTMFNYININDVSSTKTGQIVNAMEQLGEIDAVSCVWEMLSRNKC